MFNSKSKPMPQQKMYMLQNTLHYLKSSILIHKDLKRFFQINLVLKRMKKSIKSSKYSFCCQYGLILLDILLISRYAYLYRVLMMQ